MTRSIQQQVDVNINQESAYALLAATFAFLRRNEISEKSILDFASKKSVRHQVARSPAPYTEILRAYEEMGLVIATWFSNPRFLDETGHPIPLSARRGSKSVSNLIRVSRARVKEELALTLMQQSPSIKLNAAGNYVVLRRVFVLPRFELPRAALLVERYLDTLQRNALGRKSETTLLLERSCHVSQINLDNVAPILRDIKGRGTAFMDSVDGDIEGGRLRRFSQKNSGEMGVLVFAWTRPSKSISRRKKAAGLPRRIKSR